MAPLDRAIALAEVNHVSVRVGEYLNLDVAWILEIPLDVDRRVGEVRLAFATRRVERLRRLVGGAHDLHALAAAAGGGLDQQRVAELGPEQRDLVGGVDRVGRAGNDRDAGGLHGLAGLRLRAHQLDRGGRGPDPGEPGRLHCTGEARVLGQEPVPGMHRLGAGTPGRGQQLVEDEVAVGGRQPAERLGFVCVAHVEGRAVGVGVDGNRGNAEFAQRPADAQGDLSAVGNEDFREHTPYSLGRMSFADQLTVTRAAAVPIVVVLFAVSFNGHNYWATGVFCAAMATDWFDGRVARRSGQTSSLGSLLDPVADKLLVMSTLIVLLGQHVFPAWMVAAIVARELLVSGLRQAAIERGVVIAARDLGKLKTWSQAIAAAIGGLVAAGVWDDNVAWWALLVALVLTWISGLDYARSAPSVLRGRAAVSP